METWFLIAFLIAGGRIESNPDRVMVDSIVAGYPVEYRSAEECKIAAKDISVARQYHPAKMKTGKAKMATICVPGWTIQ